MKQNEGMLQLQSPMVKKKTKKNKQSMSVTSVNSVKNLRFTQQGVREQIGPLECFYSLCVLALIAVLD